MATKSRFYALRLLLACSTIAAPLAIAPAQAQSGDVVIMRKLFDYKKLNPEGPRPISNGTGDYRRIPTLVAPMTLDYPFPEDSFVFSTAVTGVECWDKSDGIVSSAFCADVENPPSVGSIPIPAQGNPYLRKVFFNPEHLSIMLPTVRNIQEMCGAPVHVNQQVWWLTCDQKELEQVVVKVPTTVQLPSQQADLPRGTLVLTTPPDTAQCMDAITGAMIEQSACSSAPNPPNMGTIRIPVTANPDVRTAVVNPSDVKAMVPAITTESLQAICSQTVLVGTTQWRLSCDLADLEATYAREATMAVALVLSGETPSTGKANFTGDMGFSTSASGVICRNLKTGASAAASNCASLPPTPGVGTFAVPATYSPKFRTVVFDKDALLANAPRITNLNALCSSTVNMNSSNGGPVEMWYVRCDPASISGQYAKVATQVVPEETAIQKTLPTTGQAVFQAPLMVNTAAAGIICRDLSTGKTATDTTRCAAMENPSSIGSFSIQGTFAPGRRKILISFANVLAVSPDVTNESSFCSDTVKLTGLTASGTASSETWSLTCDPEGIRDRYERIATEILPASSPVAISFPSTDKENFDGEVVVSAGASGIKCRDKDTSAIVGASNCTYLPSPEMTTFAVPGKFSPTYAKAYVDFDAIQQRLPDVANRASFCISTFRITGQNAAGSETSESWRITCDAEEIRPHHLKVPTTPQPAMTSIPISGPTNGKANFDGPVNFSGLTGVMCRDLDTSAFVSSSYCDRLAVPAEQSSFTVDGTFSPNRRAVLVNFDDILKIIPAATNKTAICSGSTTISVSPTSGSTESWNLTCDPENVRDHYELVATDIQTGSMRTTSIDYLKLYDGSPNFETAISMAPSTTLICKDKDDGATVASSYCRHLPTTELTRSFSVIGTISPSTQRVYMNRADIESRMPTATESNINALCNGTVNVYASSSSSARSYKATCDAEDVRLHYERVTTDVQTTGITVYANDWDVVDPGAPNFNYNLSLAPSTTYTCKDKDDDQPVANSYCANLSPSASFNSFTTPSIVSPQTRRVYIDRAAILERMPNASSANLTALCKATVSSRISNRYNATGFTMTCDPEDVRLHYERVPTDLNLSSLSISGNYDPTGDGKPNYSSKLVFPKSSTYTCRDTDNGEKVANSYCASYATPSSFNSISMNVTISPSMRKIFFDRSTLAASIPTATQANLDAACDSNVSVQTSRSYSTTYRTTCDPEDIRLHYRRIPTTLEPTTVKTSAVNYLNLGDGKADINVSVIYSPSSSPYLCRDIDDGSTVSNGMCAYIGTNSAMSDFSIPGVIRQKNGENVVEVSMAAIEAKIPEVTNLATVCKNTVFLYTDTYTKYTRPMSCLP